MRSSFHYRLILSFNMAPAAFNATVRRHTGLVLPSRLFVALALRSIWIQKLTGVFIKQRLIYPGTRLPDNWMFG